MAMSPQSRGFLHGALSAWMEKLVDPAYAGSEFYVRVTGWGEHGPSIVVGSSRHEDIFPPAPMPDEHEDECVVPEAPAEAQEDVSE